MHWDTRSQWNIPDPSVVSFSLKGLKKNCFDVRDSQEILVQARLHIFPSWALRHGPEDFLLWIRKWRQWTLKLDVHSLCLAVSLFFHSSKLRAIKGECQNDQNYFVSRMTLFARTERGINQTDSDSRWPEELYLEEDGELALNPLLLC